MKIKLYPCFKHWLEFNNIWLYSDPHFNDSEMVHLRKNYISDEEQVKRINSKVGKKDIFICLGDCGDLEFIKKIRGYKVLIKGNHDDKGDDFYKRVITNYETFDSSELKSEDIKLIELWHRTEGPMKILDTAPLDKYFHKHHEDNKLFDEVYSGPVWIAEKILLSHERIDLPFAFNIYGHHHGDPLNNDHLMCVCAEHIDYTPISLLTLLKSGTFSKVEDIHRQTIDRATERKLEKNKK